MATESQKPFSPSQSRVALAARQGLMLQSPTLWFGLLLIGTGFVGIALCRHTSFFSLTSLSSALQHDDPATFFLQQIRRVFQYAILVFLPGIALFTVAVIVAGKQKKNGQSNVPIDPDFSTVKEDLLTNIVTFLVAALVVIAIFRNSGLSYSEIEHAPRKAAERLLNVFMWSCICAGAVAILGGLIQWTLRKTQLHRHLSLTRSDLEKEQRLHGQSQTRRRLR